MEAEQRKKILIVDDEESVAYLLRRHMAAAGYETAYAATGEEALQIIEKDLPDLILLDIMMPEMNGFEVCRHLRDHEKTKKIPVIMVTALSSQVDSYQARMSGANDVVVKPVDGADLTNRVRRFIGSPFKLS
ncbi:MAG: response regulator [bacterium]